jgi:uncharacterized protein (TIGR03437 family)
MPPRITGSFLFICLLAAPLLAQPQIGGGTCDSLSLSGTYALSLTGRQVSSSGAFTSVLQANGTATFNGHSEVRIALIADTNQVVTRSLRWSGTYSVQANCIAVVTISSGGTAKFNVAINNQAKDFQLTGSDATYLYAGSGVAQPLSITCSKATLSGSYTFNASGYQLSAGAVSGAANGAGLLQFDGEGHVTLNMTVATGRASSAVTLTGSYALVSDCVGSATLTDSSSNSYTMRISIYDVTAANAAFYTTLAGTPAAASNLILVGGGHAAYAGTCSPSSLNGVYSLTLTGRSISGGGGDWIWSVGTATFDGQGNVTLAGTANTSPQQEQLAFSYAGTYSVPSNCYGTLAITTTTLTAAATTSFTLLVLDGGGQFDLEGSDSATFVYSGSGSSNRPPACATPTLSGQYTFTANGFSAFLGGVFANPGGVTIEAGNETGVLQFDGQGNVTISSTLTQTTGTYAVTSACLASVTLLGSTPGNPNTLNFAISGAYGQNLDLLALGNPFIRSGSAHSAFPNPSENIGNAASYAYSATPAGSIFVVFGQHFSIQPEGAITLPLPIQLGDTSVTVNGEPAPLFYVSSDQIDAQMPWDIQGNTVASVIVTNASSASNAAAVYVPAAGTPGISSSNDRAPVVNADGSVNSSSNPAAVGDEVVVYFTGGGPVQASGQLTAGAAAPAGESPVTGNNSITVGGVAANVVYMGLTPGSVGLYQANFTVPALAKGAYPVVITIAGNASNHPVMSVSN